MEETDKAFHLQQTFLHLDGVITIEILLVDNLTLIFVVFVKTRLLDDEVKQNTDNDETSAKVLKTNNSHLLAANKFEIPKPTKNYYRQRLSKPFKFNKKPPTIKCHCGRRGHIKRIYHHYKREFKYQTEGKRIVQTVQIFQPLT